MASVRLSFAVLVLLSSVGSAQFSQNQTDGSKTQQNQSEAQDLAPPGESPPPAQVSWLKV